MRRLEWPLVLLGWLLGAVLAQGCGTTARATSLQTTSEVKAEWHEAVATKTASDTVIAAQQDTHRVVTTTVTEPTPHGPRVTKTVDDTTTKAASDTHIAQAAEVAKTGGGKAAAKNEADLKDEVKTTRRWPWYVGGGVLVIAALAFAAWRLRRLVGLP